MRGFVVFLGLLLLLGGGAVAGARYAPVDLSSITALDNAPAVRDFLTTPTALYAGGGAAAVGLLLIILALATGGKKKSRSQPRAKPAAREETTGGGDNESRYGSTPDLVLRPETQALEPKVAPAAAPVQVAPPPQPRSVPQPVAPPSAGAPEPAIRIMPTGAMPAASLAKPQASAAPPPEAIDPRMLSRKRVQDLVTINDAIKAHYAKHGSFPKADGLKGANERGATWIPGLTPEFLPALPRDPQENAVTQYVYVSDGTDYKLLAQGVSLVGSINVQVLGIKIDPTRNPQKENASFGFWTPGFAGA